MTMVAHGAISVIICFITLFIFCVHTELLDENDKNLRNKNILKLSVVYSLIYLFLTSLLPFLLLQFFSLIPFGLLLWIWAKFGIQAMLNEKFFDSEPLSPELEKRINSRKNLKN